MKTIDQINVGDRETFSKTISESDIYLYAGLTGDFNPAHINEEYAKNTYFKKRICHGMLLGGFISTILGNKLPGPGTIYIKQELEFLAPVYIGDTITAQAEVTEVQTKEKRVVIKTICVNQEGTAVLQGQAVVSPPRAAKK